MPSPHPRALCWAALFAAAIPGLPSAGPLHAAPGAEAARRAHPIVPRRPPQFAEVVRRADSERLASRYEQAISLYREALALRPRWEEGFWHVGLMQYDLDLYADARDAFRQFVTLKPDGGAAWAFLAFCEYRLGEQQLAREHVERALRLGVGSYEDLHRVTHYHAGILMNRFGDFEQAYESLEKLAKTGDRDAKVVEALGINLLRLQYLPEEVPVEKRELVLLAGRAAYAQAAGRPEEARLHYAELLARFRESPNVHYGYGTFLLSGDADAAMPEFRREIEISPAHVEARLQLAYQHLKRGEYAEGLPYAEAATRLAPTLFTTRNCYGRLLLATGALERAVQEIEAARALEPGSAPVRFALLQAYQRSGRAADAEREGRAFQEIDGIRRAIQEGENQVRLSPKDARAHRQLAQAYVRSRRSAEARREQRIAEQIESAERSSRSGATATRAETGVRAP